MFDIILISYLSYLNGKKAKLKGQNALAWGAATVASYLFFMTIGFFVVVYNFCKDDINLSQVALMDQKAKEAAVQLLMRSFDANPLRLITIELFGVGGYLLMRYILDQKPDKKEPEVNWMDKMNDPTA